MFYYPTVLRHHSGCLSTIWLVATKAIKPSRREYLTVNVVSTCNDIMDYILERVPPPQPGLPRPRFSLYLSSQLQYGVVLVFHRQCDLLLKEVQTVVTQLAKQKTRQKLDLDDHGRKRLVLPDALSLLQEAEGAPDPLFGVMEQQETLPSLESLIQFDGVDFIGDEEITVALLMEQPDDFLEAANLEADLKRGDKEKPEEPRGFISEFQPTTAKDQLLLEATDQPAEKPAEEPGPSTEEPVLPTKEPAEEPVPSTEEPGPPSDQLTPVSVPAIPPPPSAAEAGRGRPDSERRRRQLTFFDAETQLPEEELQQQISNPLVHTRPPVLVPGPDQRIRGAADLLGRPCSFLPPQIQLLWQQAAVITASRSDLPARKQGPDLETEGDTGAIGVPIEVEQPEPMDISAPGTLPLQASDQREASREISPIQMSEREGLFPEFPEHDVEPVFFSSLLPPNVRRKTVSGAFYRLLGTLSAERLRAEQDEAYGDILILPGSQQNT
ncbi:meiotic recombination protein REC8 homolog [Amphiprion ocellaris]|uniref:meiotic recombination protein REC8 homolog n=1 Tax=Amphiprion ocellaris TaxID=80972 RepID=UPI00241161B1|nr:meiotic recombination protein REC8 homolog [Amphiprion ocellaris]